MVSLFSAESQTTHWVWSWDCSAVDKGLTLSATLLIEVELLGRGAISIFPKSSRVALGHYLTAVGLIAGKAVAMLARMKEEREKKNWNSSSKSWWAFLIPLFGNSTVTSQLLAQHSICMNRWTDIEHWHDWLTFLKKKNSQMRLSEIWHLNIYFSFGLYTYPTRHCHFFFPCVDFSVQYAQSNQQITSIWSKQAEIPHGVSN